MSRASFRLLLISFAFCAGHTLFAQTSTVPVAIPRPAAKSAVPNSPAWQNPPKLVVGIVVDQMRPDYIYRYWSNFGNGGFKRLIGEGSFLRDAHYTYMPTVTGPGHASIYTGSVPAHHGIVANDRYDRATGKMIYCVRDTSVQGVGAATAQCSPSQLLATTLADEIERRTDRQGKTIGVALKDRSSILPIGRTGDAAYWFSGNGAFVSSTWYMKQLPAWVDQFNARKLTGKYLNNTWTPLLPIEKYHQVLPDDNPYEQPLATGAGSAFPYDLAALSKGPSGLTLIASTPWGNTLTTDMALAALAGEAMGQDNHTDLLAISYSSTDMLGHKMGPRALEVEDMYIRLDQELARLLTELDRSVGAGKYTLFLTADHGAIDVPQYLKDLKASAGYADLAPVMNALNVRFRSTPDSIGYIGDGQVFLVQRPVAEQDRTGVDLSSAEREVIQVLRELPYVEAAWKADPDDLAGDQAADQRGLMQNGFMSQRCGDILYTLKPGYFEAEGAFIGKGTTHGTGWNYDTHVPVILLGQGIVHGEVTRRTAVADIMPTLSMIIGCALPDAAVGDPVPESLAH